MFQPFLTRFMRTSRCLPRAQSIYTHPRPILSPDPRGRSISSPLFQRPIPRKVMVQGRPAAGKPAFHVKSKRLSRSDCTRSLTLRGWIARPTCDSFVALPSNWTYYIYYLAGVPSSTAWRLILIDNCKSSVRKIIFRRLQLININLSIICENLHLEK